MLRSEADDREVGMSPRGLLVKNRSKNRPMHCRGSLRGWRIARVGRGLPDPQRHHHRAVHAGRLDRPAGADGGARLGATARQVVRRREPPRRRPADRRQRGRQGGARRLHAADGDQLGDGDQSDTLQEDRLRPGEGFPADRDDGASAVHPGGQQRRAGEDPRRVHQLRQGQSGQAQLRLGRRRRLASSLRRTVQEPDRHRR